MSSPDAALLRQEVEALRRELRRAQRLATVGTLAAMVAHEFNNILTPIINYAHLARKNPALINKAIAYAAQGGERASAICRAILGLTRDDVGPLHPVAVQNLVNDTLALLRRNLEREGIEVVLHVDEGLTVTARHAELQQVLVNLVANAQAALLSQESGRQIEIAARSEAEHAVIEVRDNGEGIPSEDLGRVFEPFFTGRRSDGTSQGHGLGLAICRDIVTAADGQISVASTRGKGTTFRILLPR